MIQPGSEYRALLDRLARTCARLGGAQCRYRRPVDRPGDRDRTSPFRSEPATCSRLLIECEPGSGRSRGSNRTPWASSSRGARQRSGVPFLRGHYFFTGPRGPITWPVTRCPAPASPDDSAPLSAWKARRRAADVLRVAQSGASADRTERVTEAAHKEEAAWEPGLWPPKRSRGREDRLGGLQRRRTAGPLKVVGAAGIEPADPCRVKTVALPPELRARSVFGTPFH